MLNWCSIHRVRLFMYVFAFNCQLDNFLQITDITCKSGNIHLTFDSNASAAEAFKEWSSHKNLAVLVAHERKCDENGVGTFEVSNMELDAERIAVFTSVRLQRRDIVTSWKLDVKHHEFNLEKRGLLNNFGNKIYNTVNPNITGDWAHQYDFFSNYNKTTSSSKTKKIIIFEFFQYSAYCIDCFTNGTAVAHIQMEGRLSHVTSYNLTLKGEYFINMNLKLVKGFWGENKIWNRYIFKYDLLPVNIPNALCLVPEFRVKINVKQEGWSSFATTVGMDLSVPLDIKVSGGGPNHEKPMLYSGGKPTARGHPIGDLQVGMKGNIAVRFDQEIVWGFDAFSDPSSIDMDRSSAPLIIRRRLDQTTSKSKGTQTLPEKTKLSSSPNLFQVGLVFTNRLGVQVSAGNQTHCPKEKLPFEFYHEHSLHFSVYTLHLGKRWYFWRFKDILRCWNCEQCKLKLSDLQAIANKQTITSITSIPIPKGELS